MKVKRDGIVKHVYRWSDPGMNSATAWDEEIGLKGWSTNTNIVLSPNIPTILGIVSTIQIADDCTFGSYPGVIMTQSEYNIMKEHLRVNTGVYCSDAFSAWLGM